MRYYFSGPTSNQRLLQKRDVRNLLFSYFHPFENSLKKHWINNENVDCSKIGLLVDNGAFSLWNKFHGQQVNLDEYLKFCVGFLEKYKTTFKDIYFISLDHIPGRAGERPSLTERSHSAEITHKNYLKSLEHLDAKYLLPVVHQHEDEKWCLEYEKHTDYICLSPANDEPDIIRSYWLDKCYAVLKPTTKTHGLAATGKLIMEDFPWYSTDSITWKLPGVYGKTFCLNSRKELWQKYETLRFKDFDSLEAINNFSMYDCEVGIVEKDQEKIVYQIDYYHYLESMLTEVWEAKGVVWK